MRIRAVLGFVAISALAGCGGAGGGAATVDLDAPANPDAAAGDAADPGTSDLAVADSDAAPANVIQTVQKSNASVGCPASPVRRVISVGLDTDAVVVSPRFAAERTLSGSVPGYFVAGTGLAAATAWDGVVVTVPGAEGPDFQPGDVIRITADHVEYYCLTELEATRVSRVGSAPVPPPLRIDPPSLDNNAQGVAAAAEKLEGVLVEVEDVDVLDPNPDAASGKDAGLFEVTGNLIVGNDFGLTWMSPGTDRRARGQHFRRIVGVVTFSWGRYVLMPRTDDDLEFGTPQADGVPDTAVDPGAADLPGADAPDAAVGDGADAPGPDVPDAIAAQDPGVAAEGAIDALSGDAAGDLPEDAEAAVAPGAVTVVFSGNLLPDPWVVTDPAVLAADGSGTGANRHVDQRVRLDLATSVVTDPCPLPYKADSGTIYCDGFGADDGAGHEVVIDTYAFLGAKPACTLPPAGPLPRVEGVWRDRYDGGTKVDTWVVALTDCWGVGLGLPYGGTNVPPPTTDVRDLAAAGVDGATATVRGVVTGTWTADTAWGFTLQDPGGGEDSGLGVSRGGSSATTAVEPAVGDYVVVTGLVKRPGPHGVNLAL